MLPTPGAVTCAGGVGGPGTHALYVNTWERTHLPVETSSPWFLAPPPRWDRVSTALRAQKCGRENHPRAPATPGSPHGDARGRLRGIAADENLNSTQQGLPASEPRPPPAGAGGGPHEGALRGCSSPRPRPPPVPPPPPPPDLAAPPAKPSSSPPPRLAGLSTFRGLLRAPSALSPHLGGSRSAPAARGSGSLPRSSPMPRSCPATPPTGVPADPSPRPPAPAHS